MDRTENDVIQLKRDVYKERFKCGNCSSFDNNHCDWKDIFVDENEEGCILFLNVSPE